MSFMRFRTRTAATVVQAIALLSLAFLMGACDSDSPTAPRQHEPAPNVDGTASTGWNLQLSASPDRIGIDGETDVSSSITVFARRADNGQPAPNGATVVVSTSFGVLTNAAGATGSSVAVGVTNGQGRAVLTVPGTQEGTVVIQAQLEDSFGQTTLTLEALPEPDVLFIESVSPSTGPPSGNARVTIRGTGFETPVRVLFGANPATVDSVSAEQVVVRTPAIDLPLGQNLTVAVQVTANVNEATEAVDVLGNAYTYTRGGGVGTEVDPRILSLTPRSGPNEGGTEVTIFGEGFSSSVQVLFGIGTTLIEAEILDISPTRLIVLTPSATGPNAANRDRIVNVQVINLDTGRQATELNAFQYGSPEQQVLITSISQSEGLYIGGDLVTIFGQGFDEPVAVGMAGLGQNIISVSGTEIVVRTVGAEIAACTPITGPTTVVNIETGSGDPNGPLWTYDVLDPVIISIDPDFSPEGGGGLMTISGFEFISPMRVEFVFDAGPVGVSASVVSSTEMTARIPAFAGEAFPEEECDDDGDGNVGSRFLPVRVDIRVINLATECEDTFPNSFVYIPDDQTCRGDAAPPPPPPPPPPGPDPLVASFIYSSFADLVAEEFIVTFTNTTTPPDYSDVTFEWDFRDGTPIETTVDPAPHAFEMRAVEYTNIVELTAVRGGTEISVFTDVLTIPALPAPPPPPPPPPANPPIADFTFVVAGLDVTFTNTSTNIAPGSTITWQFGDGAQSIAFNPPPHTYAAAGTYQVTLSISGSTGSDSVSMLVTVP